MTESSRLPIGLSLTALGLEREAISTMPEGFLFRYELLFLAAYGRAVVGVQRRDGEVQVSGARRVVRVSTSQTETRGPAKRGGKAPSAGGVDIGHEAALAFKRRIDRKLRSLDRDIQRFLRDDVRAGVRRCSTCRKFGEDDWLYCARCGHPMEEVS